jgi:hypothetical protein
MTLQLTSQQLADLANAAQIAQAFIALALLIYAVVFAKDIRESVRARHLDGMKYVRDLIATPEASSERGWVYRDLASAVRPLSSEDEDKARSICRDFDNIGFLCRKGLLPADIITETYRRNMCRVS